MQYVGISHLHFDHSRNVHLFINAEIFVSSDEFSKTMLDYGLGRETAVDPKEVELWVKNSLKWQLIKEDKRELLPGVVFDEKGYLDSIVKINEIQKEENLQIWFGHDIEQFASR